MVTCTDDTGVFSSADFFTCVGVGAFPCAVDGETDTCPTAEGCEELDGVAVLSAEVELAAPDDCVEPDELVLVPVELLVEDDCPAPEVALEVETDVEVAEGCPSASGEELPQAARASGSARAAAVRANERDIGFLGERGRAVDFERTGRTCELSVGRSVGGRRR